MMSFKYFLIAFVAILISRPTLAWEIDFSRRQSAHQPQAAPAPSPFADTTYSDHKNDDSTTASGFGDMIQQTVRPKTTERQEVVILNTEKGFIPSQLRLKKGVHYVVHVVNVNGDRKNVSFILDAFNQHHATYYGQMATFDIEPTQEGVFEFECPETAATGKVVVLTGGPKDRVPAGELDTPPANPTFILPPSSQTPQESAPQPAAKSQPTSDANDGAIPMTNIPLNDSQE